MTLTYNVRMENPATHNFQIEAHISEPQNDFTDLMMAVWTPGSYLIREYSRHISRVRATDRDGNPLSVEKQSKNKWRIHNSRNAFIFYYECYAFEESVRTCLLDDEHASIAPAALFIYPVDHKGPIEIRFHVPDNWHQISTALETSGNNKWTRIAKNIDELIDSPIELGNHSVSTFEASGVKHEIAVYGKGNYSIQKFLSDFPRIVNEEVRIFGSHPCTNYLFILLNSNSQRGGLEHLHSTSLIFKRFNYENAEDYAEFLGLVAHEYFHLWNVKRLRPFALGPFDYGQENYTTSLWIAEGFTSYYDDLIVRRCGLTGERNYLDVVEKNLNDGLNPPGDSVLPVAEASLDTWVKFYRQNENSQNSQVNYYVKGGLLAMMLDLMIMDNSDGRYSLDDVMREAYETFYLQQGRGYHEHEFKAILEKYYGGSLDTFYNDYVYGTRRIDFTNIFHKYGFELKDINENKPETDPGITINDKNVITKIRRNSSGEAAGLNVNDEIVAINDFRFTNSLLQTLTSNKTAGDDFSIVVSRNGILRTFELVLRTTDTLNFKITPLGTRDQRQTMLRSKWLKQD